MAEFTRTLLDWIPWWLLRRSKKFPNASAQEFLSIHLCWRPITGWCNSSRKSRKCAAAKPTSPLLIPWANTCSWITCRARLALSTELPRASTRRRRRRDLLYCPVCLVNGRIGVCVGGRIGICDSYPAKALSRDYARLLATFQPEFVKQRVVFVGITMGPTIHRNAGNVARRVEAARAERSC